MYTAAVLTPISSHLLRWIMIGTGDLREDGFMCETAQGQHLPHHMTINMGKIDKNLNRPILGCQAFLKINKLVFHDTLGICAAPVMQAVAITIVDAIPLTTIQTINAIPHITVCIKPGARPKDSNRLLEKPVGTIVRDLDQTYELHATIQQVE